MINQKKSLLLSALGIFAATQLSYSEPTPDPNRFDGMKLPNFEEFFDARYKCNLDEFKKLGFDITHENKIIAHEISLIEDLFIQTQVLIPKRRIQADIHATGGLGKIEINPRTCKVKKLSYKNGDASFQAWLFLISNEDTQTAKLSVKKATIFGEEILSLFRGNPIRQASTFIGNNHKDYQNEGYAEDFSADPLSGYPCMMKPSEFQAHPEKIDIAKLNRKNTRAA